MAGPVSDSDQKPKMLSQEVVDLVSEDEHERAAMLHKPRTSVDHGPYVAQPAHNHHHDSHSAQSHDGTESDRSGEEWETESLFEDLLSELSDRQLANNTDQDWCSLEEARDFREQLHKQGPRIFAETTVENGSITAKKLLTAFGLQPPVVYEGESDELYYPFLSYAIQREISKRRKLPHINTVDDAVQLLKRSKNVIVLTGAGISTSLGIPDFRSKGTGLYSKLEHLGLNDPQEVFNIEVFREDPTIFYSIAKDIIPSHDRYTPTHAFIRLLQDKGKLLTNYTQNIDNLEQIAGIQEDKLIQCHGSFATASCTKCGHKVPGEVIFPDMRTGRIPRCKRCISLLRGQGASMKRKRSNNSASSSKKKRADYEDSSHSEDNAEPEEAGIMKPDIIFFGEALPDGFGDRLEHHDRDKVDLCIVIGTSLKVAPVSEVVRFLPPDCPQIYISREPVKHCEFDVDLLGDCDIVVSELCRRAGWNLDHEMIPEDQKVGVALEEGFESRWKFLEIAGTHREFKPNEVKTEEKSGESNGLVRRKRKSRSPQDTTTSNSDASH